MKEYVVSQLYATVALIGVAITFWSLAASIETMTAFYLIFLFPGIILLLIGGLGFYIYAD